MRRVNRGLVVMLLAGCASAGGSAPDDAFSVRAVGECGPEPIPEVLPGPEDLVDTAGLNPAIRDLRQSADTATGHLVLSMGYQEDGLNIRRDVYQHDLQPAVADSIQKLVFAHRRTLPESGQEWGARLRIDVADEISYAVDRREYCSPRPKSREMESSMRSFLGAGTRYRSGVRERTILLRVLVHPAGYVAGAAVIRGGSPGSSLERDLITHVQQFSFDAATIDGVPVYGSIDVPIRVRG